MLLGPLALQQGHEVGDPRQLDPHVAHVPLDRGVAHGELVGQLAAQVAHLAFERVLPGGELARAGLGVGAEPLARHLDDRVDRGVDRGPHRRLVLGGTPVGRGLVAGGAGGRDHAEARHQPGPGHTGGEPHGDGDDEQCCVHGHDGTQGV